MIAELFCIWFFIFDGMLVKIDVPNQEFAKSQSIRASIGGRSSMSLKKSPKTSQKHKSSPRIISLLEKMHDRHILLFHLTVKRPEIRLDSRFNRKM